MKIKPLMLLLSLLCTQALAQTSSEVLKKEIENLSNQLISEKEKTAYLKAALELRSGNIEITLDSTTIKITEVKGSKTDDKITVRGLITYLGTKKGIYNLQCNK
ncbi:hypothetical protein [Pedobacter sp. SL55]|uniref:hypothetical protein n=1 Tax=Pedobacter sp. SL55 TaxID=2995161 RepID=UPI00226D525F|nr:hypothetical protein [Pedobacter sp. SL55]WAC38986.1 hypothetical protein OVA16_10185 [Pedobacter sp. SL55]